MNEYKQVFWVLKWVKMISFCSSDYLAPHSVRLLAFLITAWLVNGLFCSLEKH